MPHRAFLVQLSLAKIIFTEIQLSDSKKALVIDEDMFFAMRAEATLRKMGYEAKLLGTFQEALAYSRENDLCLTLMSYGKERLRPLELTRELKTLSPNCPILGYISHGEIPMMRPLSKEAGCDLLIANSAFATRLPQMIQKLAPLNGGAPKIAEAEQIGMEGE